MAPRAVEEGRLFYLLNSLFQPMTDTPNYLSAKEFADRLDLHRETLYMLLQDGEVPGARKVGGTWRIPEWAVKQVGTPAHLAA